MSETEQICFCLRDIAESGRVIGRLREQLPKARAQYDKYKGTGLKREIDTLTDMKKLVKRLCDEFPTLIQQLNEYGDAELVATTQKLYNGLKKFNYLGTSDYTPLCRALEAYEKSLPIQENNINTTALGHLMNRVRMGYFPTDPDHVMMLKRAVAFPKEPVNVIDPCCGEGLALAAFTAGENAMTYGIELDEERGEEAQNRLKRVGFGSFFHSRISFSVFQCLFLNPPYLSVPSEHGNRRLEKSFLADSMRLLADGGLLIYIIPYYRATPDVCRMLCENFEQLRVYRFLGKEFDRFKQAVFLGIKRKRKEDAQKAQKLSEYMLSPDNLQPISELPEQIYTLPTAVKPVEIFKGAVFNVAELAVQLKHSKSINRLFEDKILDKRERRPLLPLNLSQIGLVGASGLMNGLIECDTPHIIKGRIVKEKKTKIGNENEYGKIEMREIISNRLIFNILTPTGFKSLS